MANNYFQFKQFTIQQDNCAMKVCTDACLFGALIADSKQPFINCLDIGTGTGLLPLMLAQKNRSALFDAVEIDTDAAAQAKENIAASPWANRIQVFKDDISAFNPGKQYDCIMVNPPFFEDDLQSPVDAKNNAKHNTSLTLRQLLQVVNKLLAADGFFTLLLPYQRVPYFIAEASKCGFQLNRQILVKQTPKHHFFRGILFFKRTAGQPLLSELTIKDSENNYTPAFTAALQDYYLYL